MSDRATRDAYGTALVTLGKENRDVVVLDADLSKSTKTYDFSRAYPERFFNMGIAEQNLMAVAAGLARENKIPFASTFARFIEVRDALKLNDSFATSLACDCISPVKPLASLKQNSI